jgi:antitoxin (DNA-binding transcriptional repressor) of toxin-antitoxin stability system
MRIYNYSEARQNFSAVLDSSLEETVIITRKDGTRFKIVPETKEENRSPFDIEGINSTVTTSEILSIIRTGRKYR